MYTIYNQGFCKFYLLLIHKNNSLTFKICFIVMLNIYVTVHSSCISNFGRKPAVEINVWSNEILIYRIVWTTFCIRNMIKLMIEHLKLWVPVIIFSFLNHLTVTFSPLLSSWDLFKSKCFLNEHWFMFKIIGL